MKEIRVRSQQPGVKESGVSRKVAKTQRPAKNDRVSLFFDCCVFASSREVFSYSQIFQTFSAARLGFCIVALLIFGAAVWSSDQKLVMKDGTDQRVSSYEVKGDRVRYYSSERSEWEEVPDSLVDWKATEEANRAPAKVPEADIELEPKPRPPQFEVAPGVKLPTGEGTYVYDGKNLLGLSQSRAELVSDRTRRILGSMAPIIKARDFAQLPGTASNIVVSGSSPVFYLELSQPSAAGYGLVRLKLKGDSRVVGQVLTNPLTQNMSESQETVPVLVEHAAQPTDESPGVLRLTPKQPLKPGEYAVVEYVEDGKLNLFVWDFSFRPAQSTKSR